MMKTRNSTVESVPTKRWDSNSAEAKQLAELLKSGEIDIGDKPKDVWTKHTIFQCFSLDAFRAGLDKMKGDLGLRVQRQSE